MRRNRLLVSTVAAVGLVGVGCSSSEDGSGEPTAEVETTTLDTPTTSAAEASDQQPTTTGAPDAGPNVVSAGDGVLTDGIWAVGDAGTVEFAVGGGGLELIEVLENDGWSATVDGDSPDEIGVDFRRDNLEYELEIEYENGILEIEIDLDIDPAEPGAFELGPAGTAELEVDGDAVELARLEATEGWDVVEQDTSDGEVELELRRGPASWELDAEIDDGRLEVEIDFEIEGSDP